MGVGVLPISISVLGTCLVTPDARRGFRISWTWDMKQGLLEQSSLQILILIF